MADNLPKDSEPDNDWANDVKENPIHISQAISGAKGYYCMGCGKEMEAVKKVKNPKHKSYFRHRAENIDKTERKCVHASKEYREKLAYLYFMRVKEIKVPAVYKYPPKGSEGDPVFLQEEMVIKAHRVAKEVTFFEDENGIIHSGKNENITDRYLWIRPDAVFYDKEDKPILFLEFVVTHKPDIDKINKLQRLGINTVQIIVPKLPEAELEKEISKVSKVKWTYHDIESITEYLPFAAGNSAGVPSIDEEQRKLFEESYKCRAAQIGNLIRAINRCMESQSYRRIEQLFEQEIQRVADAANVFATKLGEIQNGIESEIYSELEFRRNELENATTQFQKNYSGLEARYHTKRNLLVEEQEDVEREIKFRQQFGTTEEDIRREFERNAADIAYEETDIDAQQEVIRRQQEGIIRDIEDYGTTQTKLPESENNLRTEFEDSKKREQQNFERAREELESKTSDFGAFKNQVESGIRSDFERRYQQITKRVNNQDVQGGDDLSERIKSILELRRLFGSYSSGKETLERYRKGIQSIKNGTWKEWN